MSTVPSAQTTDKAPDRPRVPLTDAYNDEKREIWGQAMSKKLMERFGVPYELEAIDLQERKATFVRRRSVNEFRAVSARKLAVNFATSTKPSDGPKVAAKYESDNPGFYLTRFDPFLFKGELTRMDDATVRCWRAVANALGKPQWETGITTRKDGGFDLVLPSSYVPSRHDVKLEEVATVIVGDIGWHFKRIPNTNRASIIPGEPPLFPKGVPYPWDKSMCPDWDHTGFGVTLPENGVGAGAPVMIDWTAASFAMMNGLPGSGKSQTIFGILSGQLAAGAELVIVDDPSKALDFKKFKPFVRTNGWGCESDAAALTTLTLVYEEGKRRGKKLERLGYENWLHLSDAEKRTMPPIFIIADEATVLFASDPVPKGLPKDHPVVAEINQANFIHAMIQRTINKIVAEQRFVGIRMLVATQVANQTTAMPPSMKNKFGHRILQGLNPSKPARDQAFNDASAVPMIPAHVQASGDHAKGVGACDLDGQEPAVYKGFYAPVDEYVAWLHKIGVKEHVDQEPSVDDVARIVGALDMGNEDGEAGTPSGKPLDPRFGPLETFDADGQRLFGAAAAAKASKTTSDGAAPVSCGRCGQIMDAAGGCACTQ